MLALRADVELLLAVLLLLEGTAPGCGARRQASRLLEPPAAPASCFHSALLQPGRCELLTRCRTALQDRRRGGRPQICGFPPLTEAGWASDDAFVPLVCCPDPPPRPRGRGQPPSVKTVLPVDDASPDCCNPSRGGGVALEPAVDKCAVFMAGPDAADKGETVAEKMCRRYERAACGLTLPTLKATAPSAGEPADRMEFPHMALLGYGSDPDAVRWACGGSLIAPDWVLTAAHCLAIGSTMVSWVLLGALDRTEATAPASEQRQLLAVAEVVRHPEYVVTGRYHDLALLRLAAPANTSREGVRPACLHTDLDGDPTGSDAVATGWGATGFGEDVSERLVKVNLTIRSLQECRRKINERTDPKLRHGIQEGQICAGGGSERDTCQGDSGGPLQVPVLGAAEGEAPCLYRVVGVVSFGPACGIGLPGVYTSVSHYVPWIEAVVWTRSQDFPKPPVGRRIPASGAPSGSCARLLRDGPSLAATGNGTLARRMCRSYMLDWCRGSGPLAMQPGLTSRDECHFKSSIGEAADPVDYPHVAMLVYGEDYSNEEVGCVGSLISPQYVLTAARCSTLGCLPVRRVLLGVTGGRGSLAAHFRSRNRQEVAVSSVLVHPDYDRDRRYNDVALVRLARLVDVSALVRPACLHTARHGPEEGLRAAATGWEASGPWHSVEGDLRRSVLSVHDARSCLGDVQGQGLPNGLRSTQLCAGGMCPNTTYPGEPGGPLQVVHRVLEATDGLLLRVHRLVGVSSLSPPCGHCLPDVYSRVAAFAPWIESVVWPDESAP